MSTNPITDTRYFRGGTSPNYAWVMVVWRESNDPFVTPLATNPNMEFVQWKDVKVAIKETDRELFDKIEAAMRKALDRNRQKRRRIRTKITTASLLPRPKSKAAIQRIPK